MHLTVAFDAFLPVARWGPLFQVLCLEHPALELAWQAVGFPTADRPLLVGADAGVLVEPPPEPGLETLTIETSPMAVTMAVGHPLACAEGLTVADILDETFASGPDAHPQWRAFWTLDERRGGPASLVADHVESAARAIELVASGRAIVTVAASMAGGLQHPGVVTIPLRDGPMVATRLVWRSTDRNPMVQTLVELADAWTGLRRDGSDTGAPGFV